MKFRIAALSLILVGVFGCIAYVFWQQELKYSLPTPIPATYYKVNIGDKVALSAFSNNNAPLYFHFYNPDCPCSLFNARHVRELLFNHGNSVNAIIVVPSLADIRTAQKEFGDHLQIIADANGEIAKACGVYSTPQAALIDKEGKLYYRGNYNRARYCTAQATNYAELALLGMLNGSKPPPSELLATVAYGCELKRDNSFTSKE